MSEGPFTEVCAHTTAAKRLYEIQLGKMLQNESGSRADTLVPYFKAKHVRWEGVVSSDLPEMWASHRDLAKYEVRVGDLLVSEGGDVGRASVLEAAPTPAIIQNALHRVRSRSSDPRFLCYALRVIHGSGWLDVVCNKATIAHLTGEKLGELRIPSTPLLTQKAIAAFLDRKTAAIDALIEKKQKLLDLLAEKRAALINQAVTKGLDPNVPMKDSGIPWIGEIPAHWHTRKLRYIAAKLQGRIIVQPHLYFVDEGVPIVFGYNIKEGKIDEGGLSKVSFEADAAHSHARARAGDLYTVRLGSPGMTAVVPQSLDGCHFASIMWVHQHQRADPHWLCHAMNSAVVQGQIDEANYGATLSQFNIADAVDWVLPFPPKAEQVAIAAFLNARLDGDLASNKAVTKQISLLQEYRQSLITAAVTGQLDIPEEAA